MKKYTFSAKVIILLYFKHSIGTKIYWRNCQSLSVTFPRSIEIVQKHQNIHFWCNMQWRNIIFQFEFRYCEDTHKLVGIPPPDRAIYVWKSKTFVVWGKCHQMAIWIKDQVTETCHICETCGKDFGVNWHSEKHVKTVHKIKKLSNVAIVTKVLLLQKIWSFKSKISSSKQFSYSNLLKVQGNMLLC